FFFFSSRRRHTRSKRDWSSDVCSSDLFGAWGAVMLLISFSFALYLGIDKLFINPHGRLITERPQFYITLTSMVLGSQLFLAGFLGEIILRTNENKVTYNIKDTRNIHGNTITKM